MSHGVPSAPRALPSSRVIRGNGPRFVVTDIYRVEQMLQILQSVVPTSSFLFLIMIANLYSLFIFLSLFILRVSGWGGAEREGERENPKQALHRA